MRHALNLIQYSLPRKPLQKRPRGLLLNRAIFRILQTDIDILRQHSSHQSRLTRLLRPQYRHYRELHQLGEQFFLDPTSYRVSPIPMQSKSSSPDLHRNKKGERRNRSECLVFQCFQNDCTDYWLKNGFNLSIRITLPPDTETTQSQSKPPYSRQENISFVKTVKCEQAYRFDVPVS